MKIMGLDVSSNSTGWCIVEKDTNLKLISYGLIRGDSSMSATQRLYFQGNELKKKIEEFSPDEIGIEETILVRGPKIMRTLARFSGVAIYQAFCFQKKEVLVFEPSSWKKILGIGGNAIKCDVQLEICSRFNVLPENQICDYKQELQKIRLSISELKALAKQTGTKKKDLNKQLRDIEKKFLKVSTDIYSDCGINSDIADSIGVAIAVAHEKR